MSNEKVRVSEKLPTPSQFSDAIQAIHTHNAEYSLGNAMARALIDAVHSSMGDHEESESVSHSEEQQMARSVLELTNTDVLEPVGLKISPVRQVAVMIGSQGSEEIGSVRLQLEDGGKFSGFLRTIESGALDENLENSVALVVSNFLAELRNAIDDRDNQTHVLELLSGADDMTKELERIGLGDSDIVKKLREYSDHAKNGDLVEFILAEKIQLFVEPGTRTFGPSMWQRDASPQFLQDRWDEVVELLRKTKSNPRASALFHELLRNAKADLDYAKADTKRIKGEYPDGYGSGFDGVFAEVEARLNQLAL